MFKELTYIFWYEWFLVLNTYCDIIQKISSFLSSFLYLYI